MSHENSLERSHDFLSRRSLERLREISWSPDTQSRLQIPCISISICTHIILTKMIALLRPILQSPKPKIQYHIPTRIAKQCITKPFSLIEPIRRARFVVYLVGEDHGYLHLAREACRDDIAGLVKMRVAHHHLAYNWKDAEEFHELLAPIKRSQIIRILV